MTRGGLEDELVKSSDSVDYLRKDAPEAHQLVMDMHEDVEVVIGLVEKVNK